MLFIVSTLKSVDIIKLIAQNNLIIKLECP